MKTLFLAIYHFFQRHRVAFWFSLVGSVAVLVFYAAKVRPDENLLSFFPKGSDRETEFVMENMRAMDKIVVIVGTRDTLNGNYFHLIDAVEAYNDSLHAAFDDDISTSLYYDDSDFDEIMAEVCDNLPIWLNDSDFARIDSLVSDTAIASRIALNREMMVTSLGVGLMRILPYDPLGITTPVLQRLRDLGENTALTMVDGYMMDSQRRNIVMFINLPDNFAQTGDNARLVYKVREIASQISESQDVDVWVYGAPIVAIANSDCVKSDEVLTLSIAITLMIVMTLLVFRRKRAIILMLSPVAFGGLFSFAGIALLGVDISLIAIGAGSTVLGIALSYSIHMLTHSLHSKSVEDLIRDMAYPMTIGSITTIGAFIGLLYTDSKILHDLGLFSSLALVGTLFFSLIFLPQFLHPEADRERGFALRVIEKFSGYDYSRNRWIVGGLCVLTIVCLFFFTDVTFDSDMTKLNYQGDEWIEASKAKLEKVMDYDSHKATLVVVGQTVDELAERGCDLARVADSLRDEGLNDYSSLARDFLVPLSVQKERIDRWNAFWTPERREHFLQTFDREANRNGFLLNAFDKFRTAIERDYEPKEFDREKLLSSTLYSNWVSQSDSMLMLYFNIDANVDQRDSVMVKLGSIPSVVVTDMGYYVRKATSTIIDDFNTILFTSSALVAFILLLSYGRFELFVMTFLPMCISWVIILGLMAIFGIQFNVVNIILSTFIFGVGDDFSIFIMDGLQSEYKSGKRILASHKTAIALSAFAIVVGLGVQVIAQHPAVRSLGLISIFGLIAVIFTSYIVQPVMFRFFISRPAQKGMPFTLISFIRSFFIYTTFLLGCMVGNLMLLVVILTPIRRMRKKQIVSWIMHIFMRFFRWIICLPRHVKTFGEIDFSTPKILIANHQSFFDIVMVMAMSPKIVFVTKTWVNNSPVFGFLTQYCGFYNVDFGAENMAEALRPYVAQGCSIMVFPEGTRSYDGEIHRFHRGAFILAEEFELDIAPMLFYGHGMVVSKSQPLHVKRGDFMVKYLPLIRHNDRTLGDDASQRRKNVQDMMRKEYDLLREEHGSVKNPYYYDAIIRNYTYKGPVLEWYMRVKFHIENNYAFYDERIARDARIVDVGCGYGPLSFMLAIRSANRTVLGLDYDEEKIDVAQNSFLTAQNENVSFAVADFTKAETDLPEADVFIVKDMLHYLPDEDQKRLIALCAKRLSNNGMIIIRDGNSGEKKHHWLTWLSELFSTRILNFNKKSGELHFLSREKIESMVSECGLTISEVVENHQTSNTIYVIHKSQKR